MTGPTFDPTALAELRATLGDDDVVAEIVETFLAVTPGHVAALVAADQRGDLPAVVAQAHSIKGSALTLGAVRMARLCEEIEAASGDLDGCAPAVAEELEELRRVLSAYVGDLRDG